MKKIVPIVLILLMVLPAMTKLSIVVNYQIHTDEITAAFCVNKENKDMHCEGKCYLEKQLLEIDSSEEQQPLHNNVLNQLESLFYAVIIDNDTPEINQNVIAESSPNYSFLSLHLMPGYFSPLFTPPQDINA